LTSRQGLKCSHFPALPPSLKAQRFAWKARSLAAGAAQHAKKPEIMPT
jgi:hypothetical protein